MLKIITCLPKCTLERHSRVGLRHAGRAPRLTCPPCFIIGRSARPLGRKKNHCVVIRVVTPFASLIRTASQRGAGFALVVRKIPFAPRTAHNCGNNDNACVALARQKNDVRAHALHRSRATLIAIVLFINGMQENSVKSIIRYSDLVIANVLMSCSEPYAISTIIMKLNRQPLFFLFPLVLYKSIK